MSDVEDMDSDREEYLPASQMIESENGNEAETENGNEAEAEVSQDTGQAATAQTAKSTRGRKPKESAKPAKNQCPCVYCGQHCAKGTVQCTICTLWCHMACTGLSKEVLRGLELQAKEVGRAYWACRACMNFNAKYNNQMREVTKRQDETEEKVEKNSDKIEEVRLATEELRRELAEQARRTEGLQERMESVMDAELREREARRLNLVIHGLSEPDASIKDPRDRMDRDKVECEKLFIAMKARTRQQAMRFCRRIGEKGGDPRPMVFGVFSEDEKRHLLEKAKELKYTCYENVTIVTDMTKSQRRGEQKLREEADRRNGELTVEDRAKNLKWLIVGKRGEKRLIKGVEREGQGGRQERERERGDDSRSWNPQISVSSGPGRMSGRGQHHGQDRRSGGQNWRPESRYDNGYSISRGGGGGGNYNSYNRGNSNSYNHNGRGGSNNYNNGYNGYNNSHGGHNYGGNSYGNFRDGGETNTGNSISSSNDHNNGGNRNACLRDGSENYNGSNNGASGNIGSNNRYGNGLNAVETGARPRDTGARAQSSENSQYGETDRLERQLGGRHVVEDRGVATGHMIPQQRGNEDQLGDRSIREIINNMEMRIQPSPLLPRHPIYNQPENGERDQVGRTRLQSNKRQRSFDTEHEEEEPQRRRF